MTMATHRLIKKLAARDVELWADGETLRYRAPRGVMTPEIIAVLRERRIAILELLRRWRVTDVTVNVAHGRLWLSTVERSYGIPLTPEQRIDPTAIGAAIAWLLQTGQERRLRREMNSRTADH
jgi:TubC N-terminal docking domain